MGVDSLRVLRNGGYKRPGQDFKNLKRNGHKHSRMLKVVTQKIHPWI